jgi:hypothetical protein
MTEYKLIPFKGDLIGVQTAGNALMHPRSCVWADCMKCDTSMEIHPGYEAVNLSDEEATAIFEREGWSIGPTRCPNCVDKTMTDFEEAASVIEHNEHCWHVVMVEAKKGCNIMPSFPLACGAHRVCCVCDAVETIN